MTNKNNTKEKSIEETLWQSCDKLRGSVEPAEYKHVVLGLIFLKFASDKFEERRKELILDGKEKYVEMKDFYTMKNVFFLEDISRWNYIIKNAKWPDMCNIKLPIPDIKIQEAIVTIFHTLETRKKINEQLKDSIKSLCLVLMRGVVENYKLKKVWL